MKVVDEIEKIIKKNSPEWNVYVENGWSDKIMPYNVFDHQRYTWAIGEIKRDYKKDRKKYAASHTLEEVMAWDENFKTVVFPERLRRATMYYFWSKCEWEIVLTTFPTFIEKEEIQRLSEKLPDIKYRDTVGLTCEKKIDVYDQICLNVGCFVDYVWNKFEFEPKK